MLGWLSLIVLFVGLVLTQCLALVPLGMLKKLLDLPSWIGWGLLLLVLLWLWGDRRE